MIGSILGSLSSGFGFGSLLGRSGRSAAPTAALATVSPRERSNSLQSTALNIFGKPRVVDNLARDQIVSDIVMLPYRNWMDQGNYGQETYQERQFYRTQYRRDPIV